MKTAQDNIIEGRRQSKLLGCIWHKLYFICILWQDGVTHPQKWTLLYFSMVAHEAPTMKPLRMLQRRTTHYKCGIHTMMDPFYPMWLEITICEKYSIKLSLALLHVHNHCMKHWKYTTNWLKLVGQAVGKIMLV